MVSPQQLILFIIKNKLCGQKLLFHENGNFLEGQASFYSWKKFKKNCKKKDFFKCLKLPRAELFQLLIFLWKGKEYLQEFR